MATPPISTARIVGMLCAIALAATAGACGDDDSPSANDKTPGNTTADTGQTDSGRAGSAQQPATDQGQIKALIAASQEAFKTGDGKAVCDALTVAGQEDIVAYGKTVGQPGTCVEVANGIAAFNKKEGFTQPPSKVVSVRVRGENALAVVRVKGTGPLRQRLKKIGGQWKQLPYGLAALAGGKTP